MLKILPFVFAITIFTASATAECLITNDTMSPAVLTANQKSCLLQAHFLIQQPNPAAADFREHLITPENSEGLINGKPIHCRYVYQQQNGASAKFRCALTNEDNQLYDEDGVLAAAARQFITEEDDVFLADSSGAKLASTKKSGKFRKAQILKVRYTKLDGRNVENYTSSAASRVLWAMGVASHRNIMTEKISCFGCSKDPFKGQKAPVIQAGKYAVEIFPEASIELKFSGKRLYSPLEKPWDWAQLSSLRKQLSVDQIVQAEIFALVTHFLTFTSTNSLQNALVCTVKSKTNSNHCETVVAMSHDIGAAFGTRIGTANGKDHPRGDIVAYRKNSIFKKGTCEFAYTKTDGTLPVKISEQARSEFLERTKILDYETLRIIITASKLSRLNLNLAQNDINVADDLWVKAITEKIQEVASASCK